MISIDYEGSAGGKRKCLPEILGKSSFSFFTCVPPIFFQVATSLEYACSLSSLHGG